MLDEKRNFANVLMTLQQLYYIAAGERCLSRRTGMWGGKLGEERDLCEGRELEGSV